MVKGIHYPPELILAICAFVYSSGLPAPTPSLDPLVLSNENGVPTALPSSVPPGSWSEPVARHTLANLCLVNHAWYAGAKPWLWRKIEVRLPRSWLSIVDEIIGCFDDDASVEQNALNVGDSIKAAAGAALASTAITIPTRNQVAKELEERILERLSAPDSPIPPELLSPPASRDPSPKRTRASSQSRDHWRIMKTIRDAVQKLIQDEEPGAYVCSPHDPRPGRFVRHLDFNHFRTIGMFRPLDECNPSRYVTGDRIEAMLKETTNLVSFGATEYMDTALTLPVLKELFLRGTPSQLRGRCFDKMHVYNAEDEDRSRRAESKDLEAIDLTGCVSAVFVKAFTEFVTTYLMPAYHDVASGESRTSANRPYRTEDPLKFLGLQRLGFRGLKSVPSHILTPFVLACPSLTHLDLSGTRASSDLLVALGQSTTMRLHSLSLARCVMLSGESIKNFLIQCPAASRIKELSLYGDTSYPSPLSEDDLFYIFTSAPCFTSGHLVYLDLSSTPLTKALLMNAWAPQPRLRSLGLSYIPQLALSAIANFLLLKAPNVEVLTLICTSPELDCRTRTAGVRGETPQKLARRAALALHSHLIRPLCVPPFSFSVFPTAPAAPPLTRVRVVELSIPLLTGIGDGASSWRVVRSKGGRGWYVDTGSGWVADGKEGSVLKRDLPKSHVLRKELNRIADANGNVSSGIGWHARKMEVLHGHGLLGREDGLYGAVSFAYQG